MINNWDNKKKINLFIVFTIIIIVLAFIIFSPSGLINRILLNQKKEELIKLINREKLIQDSLSNNINRLQKDTLEIERLAREKYGMKRPGEKIFLVPKK